MNITDTIDGADKRKSQGNVDKKHTFEGAKIQQLSDFMRQFAGIRDGAAQVTWTVHQPITPGIVTYRARRVASNHYDANDASAPKALFQRTTQHRNALARKLRRFLNGQQEKMGRGTPRHNTY